MTLILTRASKDYVLQVTDRLVTQTGGKTFDAISNKNVLYCSRNGVVTLTAKILTHNMAGYKRDILG